jgi:hypothetical protein
VLDFFRILFKSSDAELLSRCGHDAFAAIFFLRIMIKLFAVITLLSWIILVPIHVTGGNGLRELDALTFGNVLDDRKLWAHLIMLFVVSLGTIYVIFQMLGETARLRQNYLGFPDQVHELSARTLLIRDVPESLRSPSELAKLFNTITPNCVKAVIIPRRVTQQLPKLQSERSDLRNKVESAATAFVLGVVKANNGLIGAKSSQQQNGEKKSPTKFLNFLQHQKESEEQERDHMDFDAYARKRMSEAGDEIWYDASPVDAQPNIGDTAARGDGETYQYLPESDFGVGGSGTGSSPRRYGIGNGRSSEYTLNEGPDSFFEASDDVSGIPQPPPPAVFNPTQSPIRGKSATARAPTTQYHPDSHLYKESSATILISDNDLTPETANRGYQLTMDTRRQHRTKMIFGSKVDSLIFYATRLRQVEAEIELNREVLKVVSPTTPSPTSPTAPISPSSTRGASADPMAAHNPEILMPSAFIVFNDILNPHIAASVSISAAPAAMSERIANVDIKDMIWENSQTGFLEKQLRKALSRLAVIALTVFWTLISKYFLQTCLSFLRSILFTLLIDRNTMKLNEILFLS